MRIVIALGGNALGIDPKEQLANARITAKLLLPIINAGHEVVITHGNGPQVGLINLAFTEGRKKNDKVPIAWGWMILCVLCILLSILYLTL